jgi:hypothetical protein
VGAGVVWGLLPPAPTVCHHAPRMQSYFGFWFSYDGRDPA